VRVPEQRIAQIREANPIEEVIGSYIPLKKAGSSYKGVCPFHSEKTASFFVSPEKGLYHCFGCGKSGNVFGFLMAYNNLSYPESVKFLADRAGIEIDVVEDGNDNLYKVCEFVASLYHSILLDSKGAPGRQWFKKRGLTESTVEKFMLGYAPNESVVWEKSKQEGLSRKDLETLGLLRDSRDSFRSKVIFPIKNRWGRVSGFGSRVLDQSQPKYINSKESAIFKKGNLLYGFSETRSELRKEAVLVEGYTDLLSVYQSGTKNVVASLGTSLTSGQARFLKLYTPKVIIAYDGDTAGRKATERAIDVLFEAGVNAGVLVLPEGEDPDSFVKKEGQLDFSDTKSFVDFKFRECESVEEKETLIKSFKQTLEKLSDPVKRDLWTAEVAQKFGIAKDLLFESRATPTVSSTSKKRRLEDLEVELLGIVTSHSGARKIVAANSSEIQTAELKSSFALALKGADASEVIDLLPTDEAKQRFAEPSFWEDVDYEKLAEDYLRLIRQTRGKIERRELLDKIGKNGDPEDLVRYQRLKRQEG
jgi:DNA primase